MKAMQLLSTSTIYLMCKKFCACRNGIVCQHPSTAAHRCNGFSAQDAPQDNNRYIDAAGRDAVEASYPLNCVPTDNASVLAEQDL
jgi:hypothetical protein